jgi:hypothetical protein
MTDVTAVPPSMLISALATKDGETFEDVEIFF